MDREDSAGFCINCGARVEQTDRFCGTCGVAVAPALGSASPLAGSREAAANDSLRPAASRAGRGTDTIVDEMSELIATSTHPLDPHKSLGSEQIERATTSDEPLALGPDSGTPMGWTLTAASSEGVQPLPDRQRDDLAGATGLRSWATDALDAAMDEAGNGLDFRRQIVVDHDGQAHVYPAAGKDTETIRREGAQLAHAAARLCMITARQLAGQKCACCEAYDFENIDSIVIVQPYRALPFETIRRGGMQFLGEADPLPRVMETGGLLDRNWQAPQNVQSRSAVGAPIVTHTSYVAEKPEAVSQALIASVASLPGYTVTTAGAGTILITRRYTPTWRIVLGIVTSLLFFAGLLLLLSKKTETITVLLAPVVGGTAVAVSGIGTRELASRIEATLSAMPALKPDLAVEASARHCDGTKVCPDCAEVVKEAARVCRFCGHEFALAGGDLKA
jgi:Uncharacterised protein family UPF0547